MKTLVIPLGKSPRPAEVLVEIATNLEWMAEEKMIIPVIASRLLIARRTKGTAAHPSNPPFKRFSPRNWAASV